MKIELTKEVDDKLDTWYVVYVDAKATRYYATQERAMIAIETIKEQFKNGIPAPEKLLTIEI